jgi:hypothetical protein
MSVCLPRGVLTLSIDLEVAAAHLGLAERRSLETVTARLLELVGKYELPATWAVADPAVSAATERIVSLRAGHEIAISGDATWVGREAGRSRFGRELARRTAHARASGLAISTLILKTSDLEDHSDLAIKQGITAVRHPETDRAAHNPRRLQPQTLRFGLWSFPVSLVLPHTSRWLPGGGGVRTARALIDQAICDRGLVQLAIDAPQLALRGFAAECALQRVLQHAERRRRQGILDVVTLGNMANKLSSQTQSQPSHSILRPAA